MGCRRLSLNAPPLPKRRRHMTKRDQSVRSNFVVNTVSAANRRLEALFSCRRQLVLGRPSYARHWGVEQKK